MKFAKGQLVSIVPLNLRGWIIHGFPVKRYAVPDEYHYTVRVEREAKTYEVLEEELT